ncbi:MAG: hypothetical protein KatS3mg031_0070 [Chitinophagales bacterium]|nr:MAG: hypothetical protein KatS3mg031_0070 [Chitinophagales bacterium]
MDCGRYGWCVVFLIFSGLGRIPAYSQDTLRIIDHLHRKEESWLVRKDLSVFLVPRETETIKPNVDILIRSSYVPNGKKLLIGQVADPSKEELKKSFIKNIQTIPGAELLIAISKVHPENAAQERILFINNQLLVGFRAAPDSAYLQYLMHKYGLRLYNSDAPTEGKVLVFSCQSHSLSEHSGTIAMKIAAQEKENVLFAQPNRINLFEPQGSHDSYTGDFQNPRGQMVSCAQLLGEHLTDAHVTEVWDQGFTGTGIKVGVLDFFGFDFHHPDMSGQLIPGWDCINNSPYDASNYYYTDNTQAHGMAVAGIIGAKRDNNLGSAGVAYGARLVPFLIDGSEASVVLAMQKARTTFDVDIINCSFGSYFESPAIEAEIQNLVTEGRIRNGMPLGIVVVASHGNDNYNDMDYPQYPATYAQVVSVAASTPDDYKKTPSDQWNTGAPWGSNYGSRLKLAAPGVCIYTTDISGSSGYASGDYISLQKTSASAPIVSGVAALLLEKEPHLTWQEVVDRLTASADKVHSDIYQYYGDQQRPGHSIQVGYGRINAAQALSGKVNTFAANNTQASMLLGMPSLVADILPVHYVLPADVSDCKMIITDIHGTVLLYVQLPQGTGDMRLDVSALSRGIYFVKCFNNKTSITKKFIKSR